MKKILLSILPLAIFAGFIALGGVPQTFAAPKHAVPQPAIDPEKIRAHVKFLASDLLEGRGTGQRGGDIAAEYIATQFSLYGLKPAGENGTYFQDVPMVGEKTLPETSFQLVPANGEALTLKYLDDFVTNDESQANSADIDAPIVFVGYGITAPEYQWDDYKGTDLKGKVALLFVNEPISNDPKFFKGEALTYYGRWTYKFEETARRGAIATLIIHRSDLASYGWDVVRNSWGTERAYLKNDGTPKLRAASWIQLKIARKLVAMGGLDVDKLFAQSQSRDFKPVELPVRLKAHVASHLRPFISRNVLAMLEGADPKRNDDAILYTAHYDHLGIDTSKTTGDNIYNGAVDNATGCGILLELARAWANDKKAPPRSILFAAVTAEEQGLLGSEYLGKRTIFLPADPVLDLNFDALAPIGIPEEVEVSGAERTTFYPTVEATAKQFKLAIRPDAHPEAGHYYRSDHFSLARVGIPSFSINEGLKYAGHDDAWGEAQAKDYVEHHYHQPSDEYSAAMDFQGDALIAEFGYALGRRAAEAPAIPEWLQGDEFEKAKKNARPGNTDLSALFIGMPELHLIHSEPLGYPPLARLTRITGKVVIHVTVGSNGYVQETTISKGHPLLRDPVEQNVKKWRFEPLASQSKEFDLTVEFVLAFRGSYPQGAAFVGGPLALVILGSPPPLVETMSSAKN